MTPYDTGVHYRVISYWTLIHLTGHRHSAQHGQSPALQNLTDTLSRPFVCVCDCPTQSDGERKPCQHVVSPDKGKDYLYYLTAVFSLQGAHRLPCKCEEMGIALPVVS